MTENQTDTFKVVIVGLTKRSTIRKVTLKEKEYCWKESSDLEFEMMKDLIHENIPRYYRINIGPAIVCMEWVPGVPLAIPTAIITAKTVAARILSVLIFIHSKGIFHGDIKPCNVLVGLSTQPIIKLVDWEFSGYEGEDQTVLKGTPYYTSPEVLLAQKRNCKSDVWALAITVSMMLVARTPYPKSAKTVEDLVMVAQNSEFDFYGLSSVPGALDFVSKIVLAKTIPRAEDLLDEPFVQGV